MEKCFCLLTTYEEERTVYEKIRIFLTGEIILLL